MSINGIWIYIRSDNQRYQVSADTIVIQITKQIGNTRINLFSLCTNDSVITISATVIERTVASIDGMGDRLPKSCAIGLRTYFVTTNVWTHSSRMLNEANNHRNNPLIAIRCSVREKIKARFIMILY